MKASRTRKVFLQAALTFLFWIDWESGSVLAAPLPNESSFLSQYASRVVQSAVAVEAAPLASMRRVPKHVLPGDPDFYKILSDSQRLELLELLLAAKEIDPQQRLAQCKFEPGVKFTFYLKPVFTGQEGQSKDALKSRFESKALSLLLCFNCDLWAIGESGILGNSVRKPEEVAFFGDARPARQAMEKLVFELFGESFFKRPK